MLEKLALKHKQWLNMAKGICKDAYLADDLVSEMYLKFANYDKEVNDFYVYYAIKHIYIDWLRNEKKKNELDVFHRLDWKSQDEFQDGRPTFFKKEQNYLNLCTQEINFDEINKELEIPDCITWVEKQVLLLRQELSGRDIERKYKINFQKVHRIENNAKKKIQIWLEEQKEQSPA